MQKIENINWLHVQRFPGNSFKSQFISLSSIVITELIYDNILFPIQHRYVQMYLVPIPSHTFLGNFLYFLLPGTEKLSKLMFILTGCVRVICMSRSHQR